MVSITKRATNADPRSPDLDEARRRDARAAADGVARAAPANPADRRRTQHSARTRDWRLDWSLFVVICVVLGVLLVVLCMSLYVQYLTYSDAIAHGLGSATPVDHASLISYSRALDFAVAKTAALFLAFALVFVGALYVLRIGEADYRLTAGTQAGKGSFQTSSPGLVMVTLGVMLIALVLNTKSAVEYSRVQRESAQPTASTNTASTQDALRAERPPLSRAPPQSTAEPTERR